MDLVALVAGSGWASGLNLYAVVWLLGVLGRLGIADVPDVLTHPAVIGVAVALYLVEFVADKIPYVDSAWDVVHTVIRPLGAALLAVVLVGDASLLGQSGAGAGAAVLALTGHAAKATTRAAVNTSPEPASNVAVSLFEDGLVAAVVWFAVTNPLLALGLVVLLTVAAVWLTAKLWGAARRFLARRRVARVPSAQSRPGRR